MITISGGMVFIFGMCVGLLLGMLILVGIVMWLANHASIIKVNNEEDDNE